MSNAMTRLDAAAQAEVEELLERLIATPSINPWITPGAAGEGEVAALISSWLRELDGVEVTATKSSLAARTCSRASAGPRGRDTSL